MKQKTAQRIEQAIVDELYDTINGGFTVTVAARLEPGYPWHTECDAVIFEGTDRKKDSKKLVKALLAIVEDANIGVVSSSKSEVLFCKGDLKKIFPKEGFLTSEDRKCIKNAVDYLIQADTELAGIFNAKANDIQDKIIDLRYDLENL